MQEAVLAALEVASGVGGWRMWLVGGSRRRQRPPGDPPPPAGQHHDAGEAGWRRLPALPHACLLPSWMIQVQLVHAISHAAPCHLSPHSRTCSPSHSPTHPPTHPRLTDFVASHPTHEWTHDLLGRLAEQLLAAGRIMPRESGAFFALQVRTPAACRLPLCFEQRRAAVAAAVARCCCCCTTAGCPKDASSQRAAVLHKRTRICSKTGPAPRTFWSACTPSSRSGAMSATWRMTGATSAVNCQGCADLAAPPGAPAARPPAHPPAGVWDGVGEPHPG